MRYVRNHFMWRSLQRTCLAMLLSAIGCNSRPTTLAMQGEVSYDGQTIQSGRIDFVPVENTPGWSATASITNGRYEIAAKRGLSSDGVYLVQITAFRKTGRTEPNRIDRRGPPVEIEENFIPPCYNSQTTLKVRVVEVPDRNRLDFRLGKTPVASTH